MTMVTRVFEPTCDFFRRGIGHETIRHVFFIDSGMLYKHSPDGMSGHSPSHRISHLRQNTNFLLQDDSRRGSKSGTEGIRTVRVTRILGTQIQVGVSHEKQK